MTFSQYDVVQLSVELKDKQFKQGLVGTMVAVYTHPSLGYDVEFMTDKKEWLSTVILTEAQIEPADIN